MFNTWNFITYELNWIQMQQCDFSEEVPGYFYTSTHLFPAGSLTEMLNVNTLTWQKKNNKSKQDPQKDICLMKECKGLGE